MRHTYRQTPETIQAARRAAAIERAEIYRQTGVVIDEDGTVHLPEDKSGPAVNTLSRTQPSAKERATS